MMLLKGSVGVKCLQKQFFLPKISPSTRFLCKSRLSTSKNIFPQVYCRYTNRFLSTTTSTNLHLDGLPKQSEARSRGKDHHEVKDLQNLVFPIVPEGKDFKFIREQRLYFKDTTYSIKVLHDISASKGRVPIFVRPRRFGKSLLLSTLQYFYDVNEKDSFDFLFKGLAIYQHAEQLKHSQYAILQIDFSRVQYASDTKELDKSIHNVVNEAVRIFCQKYNPGHVEVSDDCRQTLNNLFTSVEQSNSHPVMLLVDEFAYLVHEYMLNSQNFKDLQAKSDLLRSFYAVLKGHLGKSLKHMVIVGTASLSLTDNYGGGFDVGEDVTFNDDLEQVLSLKDKDVEQATRVALQRKGNEEVSSEEVNTHLDFLRSNYGGYYFSSESEASTPAFHTTAVLKYLQKLREGKNEANASLEHRELIRVLEFLGNKTYDSFKILRDLMVEDGTKTTMSYEIQQLNLFKIQADGKIGNYLKALLYYFGAVTFDPKAASFLRIPNFATKKHIIDRGLEAFGFDRDQHYFHALNTLYFKDDPTALCDYIQTKAFKLANQDTYNSYNEFAAQVGFLMAINSHAHFKDDMNNSLYVELSSLTKLKIDTWDVIVGFERINSVETQEEDAVDEEEEMEEEEEEATESKDQETTKGEDVATELDEGVSEKKKETKTKKARRTRRRKPPPPKRKCFLFAFKHKNLELLQLPGLGTSPNERLDHLRKMPKASAYSVKATKFDRADARKSMKQILDGAFLDQLNQFAEKLINKEPEREVVAHCIISVGATHVLHKTKTYSSVVDPSKLSLKELQIKLKKLGLDTNGRRADLLPRLQEALANERRSA